MRLFSSLSREQKESIGLLQIGTFLEYFDLMLYIHMAVFLNEIFFPETDPHTAALLAAFAFCSTYVMRPIGALIFGWLGDTIGRKSTIIITTVLMSVSCIVMANLPTYAQIGITAAWIMTICRILQGMSSMGEIIGAQIYVAESIPRPISYPAVAFIPIASAIGSTVAIGVSVLVTSFDLNWRIAFWMGAVIALVGAVARARLRETPDFLEMKRQQMKQTLADLKRDEDIVNPKKNSHKKKDTWKEPIDLKTLASYFLIFCGWPLNFYLAYIYFNPMLKASFGYSAENIIKHNFFLSLVVILGDFFYTFLSCRIHPIRILKIRWGIILLLMIFLPFIVNVVDSPTQLFCLQALLLFFPLRALPADAVMLYHFPIYRRFTFATFLYALSRALMYIITSFGLVYLGSYFGIYGLWFITIPITLAYFWGVLHFEILERKLGIYPNLSRVVSLVK